MLRFLILIVAVMAALSLYASVSVLHSPDVVFSSVKAFEATLIAACASLLMLLACPVIYFELKD